MASEKATELLPCPFCGCKAHFEMDDDRWEWVECGSCGMEGNRSASLMEDCKPKLAEAWNRRAPSVPVPQWGKAGTCEWHDGYADHADGGGPYKERVLYTAPQAPTTVRHPLTDSEIEDATGAKQGTPLFLAAKGFTIAVERAHGIGSKDT